MLLFVVIIPKSPSVSFHFLNFQNSVGKRLGKCTKIVGSSLTPTFLKRSFWKGPTRRAGGRITSLVRNMDQTKLNLSTLAKCDLIWHTLIARVYSTFLDITELLGDRCLNIRMQVDSPAGVLMWMMWMNEWNEWWTWCHVTVVVVFSMFYCKDFIWSRWYVTCLLQLV